MPRLYHRASSPVKPITMLYSQEFLSIIGNCPNPAAHVNTPRRTGGVRLRRADQPGTGTGFGLRFCALTFFDKNRLSGFRRDDAAGGDRGGLPHAATKEFARSYRINLRLLPELAFSSGHDVAASRRPRAGGFVWPDAGDSNCKFHAEFSGIV